MSIRLRLTLLYSVILALTLILFGVALYGVVYGVTFKAAQDTLTADAAILAALHPTPSPPLALTDTFIQIRRLDYKRDSLQDIFLKAMETREAGNGHGRL